MAVQNPSSISCLDALRKILPLEAKRGYSDKVVAGGLDSFVKRNRAELEAAARDKPGLLKVSYEGLNEAARKRWVEAWQELLEKDESGEATAPAPEESPGPGPAVANKTEKGTRPARSKTPPLPAPFDSSVVRLSGVNDKTAARLKRLGISTINDLLYFLPRKHNDYSAITPIADLVPGEQHTIVGTVWESRQMGMRDRRRKAVEAVVGDESGNLRVVWFGNTYMERQLKPNVQVVISGRVEVFRGQMQFENPDMEVLDGRDTLVHTARLVPVYRLTEGIFARRMRSIVWQALKGWAPHIKDHLPSSLLEKLGMPPLSEAISQAHYPDDLSKLTASRRRLAFDELFMLQLVVLQKRNTWESIADGVPIKTNPAVLRTFLAGLPFEMTGSQKRCIGEILQDMSRDSAPMNRLLQGEVGSGKTVVAVAALLETAVAGHQGSIMVPTEVLAEQHFATLSNLAQGLAAPVREENTITFYLKNHPQPISAGLLTGSTKPKLKRELTERAAEGSLDILIGTHALIQETVSMPRLALAVVDEQHRFGVGQRAALRQMGGATPHVLVMSATPIPRTLTLTLYGDLDVSIIDELPPGRQQVRTHVVPPERRDDAYRFVRTEVLKGRQAFIICPLIEESEAIEARAATEEFERLSTHIFPDLKVELLHGRMGARQKEAAMRRFKEGSTDILVSTAVVEVGVDVPNATVMVVEAAHRFGLAQLHQFRGRVGRGQEQSYCFMLSDYSTPEAKERLNAMERINDGFELAEVDLSLRGPGDFFGTRQSGLPNMRVAGYAHQDILLLAREEAALLLDKDPKLEQPEHQDMAQMVKEFLGRVLDEVT